MINELRRIQQLNLALSQGSQNGKGISLPTDIIGSNPILIMRLVYGGVA